MSQSFVFVHEGFPSYRGAYLVEKGELRLVSRGIYAPHDAVDEDLMGDALRALAYRYDGARLMGESARRVMEDGLSPVVLPQRQVFAAASGAGARRERELFPGVSVVLRPDWRDSLAGGSLAGGSPFLSLSKRMVSDLGHGGMTSWDAPCDAQILWDAAFFPECAPPPEICMRLLQNIPEAHLNHLLAHPEIQKAALSWEAAASRPQGTRMPPQQSVSVFLQDLPVGLLAHDGVSWRMKWIPERRAPVVDSQWGSTIESLMPEGWQEEMESAENMRDPQHFLRQPRRLMNWTFLNGSGKPSGMADVSTFNRIPSGAELESHVRNGVFQGTMDIPWANMAAMKDLFSVPDVPRISGFQPKVAGFLDGNGCLAVSDASKSFTVLMKIDPCVFGVKKLEGIPVLEWACQNAGRHAGLSTANGALAVKPDGSSAIMLSERFDVPRYGDYDRYDIALDGAAAMGLHTSQKYNVSTAKLWKSFLENGLPPQEATAFFDRFVAAWVMADGDLHVKNVSMIWSARNDGQDRLGLWTSRISPAYDMVCTRAFDFLKNDRMASIIEGKQDDLRMKNWLAFGKRLGISEEGATHRVLRIATGIAEGLDAMTKHPVLTTMAPDYQKTCRELIETAASLARIRALDLGVDATHILVLDPERLSSASVADNRVRARRPDIELL
ncbi:MAG: HipA domain-containing protein [Acidithiobacillus sp.]